MSALEIGLSLALLAMFAWGNHQRIAKKNAINERDVTARTVKFQMVSKDITHEMALRDKDAELGTFHAQMVDALPDDVRYEIRLADWGPDFTGADDTLHRWRWILVDADHDLKQAFETPPYVDAEPVMLGNAPTAQIAYVEALQAAERLGTPVVVFGPSAPPEDLQ